MVFINFSKLGDTIIAIDPGWSFDIVFDNISARGEVLNR